jgi:peptidoglycan/xylan/chitin deacetylase (PgdA/CDA1 family)
MSIRSSLKWLFYRGAHLSGANAALLGCGWRARRLLILCYHGISLDDEHEWSGLYISPELFRSRMEALRRAGCCVLRLQDAVDRLYRGTLPPRAVVITFDDGFYDFAAKASPVLREFQYPATVYFSTYYSIHNLPVFDPMCGYLLWKGRGRRFSWPEMEIAPTLVDSQTEPRIATQLQDLASQRRLTAPDRNELLQELASRLEVDFDAVCSRRILHLMKPEEAARMAREGIDFELHCHRHRVYRSRDRFQRELEDNRQAIQAATGQSPTHFCYPGGFLLPEFPGWLAEFGIASATTCESGLASRVSGRYELPRLLDTAGISPDEFSAWLSGLASFLPRTSYPAAESQLVEEDAPISPGFEP